MTANLLKHPYPSSGEGLHEAVLNALSDPILIIGAGNRMDYVNAAAEQFFQASVSYLKGKSLQEMIPGDSPLFTLIDQVRQTGSSVSEYGVTLETPRIGTHILTIQVSMVGDRENAVVVMFHERSIALKMDRQLTHRNVARSVTAMAAILAHEIKNPLSGIRGAAQLLEQNAEITDRPLTRLIIEETDRICGLIDRMEMFTDRPHIERDAVNIHQVLEHVRRIAQNGFGKHLRFIENYDPSLPPVAGNRDQLIQVLLNLVKNAAEACPQQGGEIVLSTAYQHGVRLALPGSDTHTQLPLVVSVQDNGDGIPEDLRPHLFDPFVTTKVNGTGLGLALVAKIIGDHGGIVEFSNLPKGTAFRVHLPIHQSPASSVK
ncbi:MAG TPA: ATP-binding protein [Alphaproteobacteria bacterium]|jgi:two-component system nitrogen regulation sensor histidine kinase GlnL